MPISPEVKPQAPTPPPPEGVISRPETFVVPEQIQKIATSTPTQITTQVTDDSTGQPLTQSPATHDSAIQIPVDPVASQGWRKWSLSDAITWFTVFWLRTAKKATHLGKKIVFVGRKDK